MLRICSLWSSENVRWKDSNWTWDDCELVAEVCQIWNQSGFLWVNANRTWAQPDCIISPIPPVPVIEVRNRPGVDAQTLIQPWQLVEEEPWDAYKEKKKKRLIELICRVKNQRYIEEKEVKNFDISIDDVRLVVKAVSGVELKIR